MRMSARTLIVAATLFVALFALPVPAQEPVKETPPPAPAPAPTPPPPPAPPPAATIAAPMVEKAKIVVEDKAENDGKIDIVFTADKASPMTISTLVAKKMKGKEIAEDLAKNLKVSLGPTYKVEASGDAVEIKGKDDQKFSVAVGSNTVTGLSIKIK